MVLLHTLFVPLCVFYFLSPGDKFSDPLYALRRCDCGDSKLLYITISIGATDNFRPLSDLCVFLAFTPPAFRLPTPVFVCEICGSISDFRPPPSCPCLYFSLPPSIWFRANAQKFLDIQPLKVYSNCIKKDVKYPSSASRDGGY